MKRNPYGELPAVPGFELRSNVIADARRMQPDQSSGILGAGGHDRSPDLEWSGFPDETQSFMITMYNPDAPTPSGFWRWAIINVPVGVTSLAVGAGDSDDTLPSGAMHLVNDAGLHRYLGAAPPPGEPLRYFVVVSALDTADTGLSSTTPALASFHLLPHTIGRAMLVPVYGVGDH
jgi:Raf kinase inhibitor-like YbhB/YbcL family protein